MDESPKGSVCVTLTLAQPMTDRVEATISACELEDPEINPQRLHLCCDWCGPCSAPSDKAYFRTREKLALYSVLMLALVLVRTVLVCVTSHRTSMNLNV